MTNRLSITKEKLAAINSSLLLTNSKEHCLLINEIIMEIKTLREVIAETREALKHPEDAYENAFSVFDALTKEIDAWESSDRVRIDI